MAVFFAGLFLALTSFSVSVSEAAIRQDSVGSLPYWADFQARQNRSMQALSYCESNPAYCESAEVQRWAGLVGDLRNQNKLRQIITVNKWFNRLPYKYDEDAHGSPDYWASTKELLKYRGDCEDFALSKYYTLRALGFSPDQLKVMAVYDKDTFTNHAVLMVYVNGTRYMLDINADDTSPTAMGTRYRPLYSFNEQNAWFY